MHRKRVPLPLVVVVLAVGVVVFASSAAMTSDAYREDGVELDESVMDALTVEDIAVVEALVGSRTRQRSMASSTLSSAAAVGTAQGPPVLRLTDVKLDEIAGGDVYRFVLRLRREGDIDAGSSDDTGACTSAELMSLSAALCGDDDKAYDASCIKEAGTHFTSLPYLVVTFANMAELARVRDDFGHCISFFERDMAEHVVVGPTYDTSVVTSLWNLDRVDQETWPLDHTFNVSGVDGTGVHIFVIDTGVWASHDDFGGRVGITHTTVEGASSFDLNGHGTHCAGIAASATYGVAKNATVHSIKVLSDDGLGTSGDVIEALDYVINIKDDRPETPIVVSLSLGGGFSLSLNFAVAEAMEHNVTVIAAAGNDADDACFFSPSSSPAITVGSVDNTVDDRRSSFSNYGSCVDIYAPGQNILSTGTGWNVVVVEGMSFSNSEATRKEGTSMAAPHVTGAAALYLQQHPRATPAQVREAIMADAVVAAGSSPSNPRHVLVIGKTILTAPTPTQIPEEASAAPFSVDSDEPASGSFLVPPPELDEFSSPPGSIDGTQDEEYTCEVTEWTSWSACSATRPCTSGFRSRYRFVANDIPLDLVLVECPLLTTIETCVAENGTETECVSVGDPSASPLSGVVRSIVDTAIDIFS